MKRFMILILALVLIVGCSSGEKETVTGTASYLPKSFDNIGLERISDVRTYVGNDLWEYIDGGAELYHLFGFVEVSTADYLKGETELVIDIYKFNSSDDAYGLYTQFRQTDNTILKIGVEGFVAPGTLNFVKGVYLVRVTGYDDTDEGNTLMVDAADALNKIVPGKSDLPVEMTKFPDENAIGGSGKYFAESFLGHNFLNGVFSLEYSIDGKDIMLFIGADETGQKYAEWKNYAEKLDKLKEVPSGLTFDENYAFLYEDGYYGNILAGLKNGYLVGMVGYDKSQKNRFEEWVNGI